MKTLYDILLFGILFILLLIVSTAFGIIAPPILIIMSPFGWIKAKKDTKEFDEYLVTLGNKNFFCYNNRVKGFECINNEIIPNLHEDVEPIFLIGKSIENTSYDTGYLSNIFRHFKNYNRFPHLVKIRNGEIFDTSLNSEFFSYLDTGKNKKRIDRKIEQFFEFKEIGK